MNTILHPDLFVAFILIAFLAWSDFAPASYDREVKVAIIVAAFIYGFFYKMAL